MQKYGVEVFFKSMLTRPEYLTNMLNSWSSSRSIFKHNMNGRAFGTRLRYEMTNLF